MGQTVVLELMARFEVSRTPFRIRHEILMDGSTLIDMIQHTPFQVESLNKPSVAMLDDMAWSDMVGMFKGSFSMENAARSDYQEILTCMSHQVHKDHGRGVIGAIVHYL